MDHAGEGNSDSKDGSETTPIEDYPPKYIRDIPQAALPIFMDHYMPARAVWAGPGLNASDTEGERQARPGTDDDQCGAFEAAFGQVVARCEAFKLGPGPVQTTSCSVVNSARGWTVLQLLDQDYDLLDPYAHAVVVRLRMTGEDRTLSHRRLVRELMYILRTEPGRRFVLGMSVDGQEIRLWHLNREIVVVSAPLDCDKDRETFVDILARLAFAPPPQLGYDPTFIKGASLEGGDRENDQLLINGATYELTGLRARHCPGLALGHSFWVWDARDLRSGEAVVIKDSWPEDDRPTEFEIQADIRARIRAFDWGACCVPPPEGDRWLLLDAREAGRVDPRYHEDVDRAAHFAHVADGEKVAVDGRVDNTHSVMARGHAFPSDPLTWETFCIDSQDESPAGGTLGTRPVHITPYDYMPPEPMFAKGTRARAHHRIVMSRGQPLDKITDPATAFRVLRDASYAMFIMHTVGYLHRGPSAPDVLLSSNGLGVLSNLEYATRFEDVRDTQAGRMGTANYVAIEALQGRYLFDNTVPISRRAGGRLAGAARAASIPRTPWSPCELHDLESMFWIALWVLFRHTLSCYTDVTQKRTSDTSVSGAAALCYDIEAQRSVYEDIFPGQWLRDQTRRNVLCGQGTYDEFLDALPPEFQASGSDLGFIRYALMRHYEKSRERKVHGALWNMLYQACAESMDLMPQNVKLVPLSSIPSRTMNLLSSGAEECMVIMDY